MKNYIELQTDTIYANYLFNTNVIIVMSILKYVAILIKSMCRKPNNIIAVLLQSIKHSRCLIKNKKKHPILHKNKNRRHK